MTTLAPRQVPTRGRIRSTATLLGPAFVAAVAYVDPGNVATNITAGSRHGYLLVWVVVLANAMAAVVQYMSAKLGLVTGRSLPEVLRERLPRWARLSFWGQAELVAVATDLAEIVGGAVALALLFDLPLLAGGLITAIVSMVMLAVQHRRGQRNFEHVISTMLAIIAVGFLAGLVLSPPDAGGAVAGMAPRFEGPDSVVLAAGLLGATVMPHAVYLHSALARDRHGRTDETTRRQLISATKWDVGAALMLAGAVNLGMLLLAASTLQGVPDTDTLQGAHAAIEGQLGAAVALLFAVALLASGLASTSVGCYAGAVIMQGLLQRSIPLMARRALTAAPALVVLAVGIDPTRALIVSQVILSFGIPFALLPLIRLTADHALMGAAVNRRATTAVACMVAAVVVALNAALMVLTLT